MRVKTLIHNVRKVDADGIVEDFWLEMLEGQIFATGTGHPNQSNASQVMDGAGGWLSPGFIDLHCHGGAGLSFGPSAEEISAGLVPHRQAGTTRSVISLVSGPLESMTRSLDAVASLARADTRVLGSHIEGPFLSRHHHGAHDPHVLQDPNRDIAHQLLEAADGTLVQATIAPELTGAFSVLDTFVDNGVRVGLGHTDATYALAKEAFTRGATLLTHAFNAMRPIHHREPGPVLAAFEDNRVTLELILDGHHVGAEIAGLAYREAPGRIALVTDAMAAAGIGQGSYRLGSLLVTVEDNRAVVAGTDTLAGSTLTQDVALRFALHEVGLSPVEAITALTLTPSRAVGHGDTMGLLRSGFVADAVLMSPDWTVNHVWADGVPIR